MISRILIAALLLSSPVVAEAADWSIDTARSRLGFSGTQVGVPFTGRFKRFTAAIAFDPIAPSASHAVVVVDLTSAETGDAQRDVALPQADWFDTKTTPQARFEVTRFVGKGGNDFDAVGSLTIRGIRRDLILPVRVTIDGATAHAAGQFDLNRTDFGVGQGPWASGQWVALAVRVHFELFATQR